MIGALLSKEEEKDNTIVENKNETINKNVTNENLNNKTNISEGTVNIVEEEGIPQVTYNKIVEVDNPTYFYTVRQCIDSYLEDVAFIDDEDEGNDYKKAVYNQLSDNYIRKNKIDIENLSRYVKSNNEMEFVKVDKMLQYMIKDNNIMRFFVSEVYKKSEQKVYYYNYIVYLDYINLTYSIEPTNKESKEISKDDLSTNINEINLNDDNKYMYKVKTSIDYTK